ncbi:MAG: TIGR04255 family protein [Nitrospirae bacterium]|nr:TIGR04255 family protein [Candidatus Troglogloeales bacterium]
MDQVIPERRYRKPPIIEAFCEIAFADSMWDETIPGVFYEQVKKDFPQKRPREIQQAEITFGPSEATAGVRRLPPRVLFVSDAKHRMIQVAKDLLVVNQLHPYPHFEEWEPEVFNALSIYRELAQPKKVVHLGLRYVNRVVIPEASVKMEDYFTIYPKLPLHLGNSHRSFLVQVEIPQPTEHTVVMTFGTAPLPNTNTVGQAFMLDLYCIRKLDKFLDEEIIKKEIKQAHTSIITAFEDSITDKLREKFEPEEQI